MQYIIGTRGSKLAVAQAEFVQKKLQQTWPEHSFILKTVQTKGDKILNKPLAAIGGKGLFVREIEEQLLSGEIHIAVHSMKDMPVEAAAGLAFAHCLTREDPRDVLVLREASSLDELPHGAVIGTGSIRRKVQLLRLRPDLQVCGIRGNVDTRLRKMEEERMDGIVLAAAGLRRLGMQEKITQYLSFDQMIPSPAQGALALEFCEKDQKIRQLLAPLCDEESEKTTSVERKFLKISGGDCHMPVAAFCEKTKDGYRLRAMTGESDGGHLVFADVREKETDGLAEKAFFQMKSDKKKGTVYLVGAGPGDPGLFTLRGEMLLKQAECVVYDRLIPKELLELTSVECERIYVGKSSHNHTMKQEDIQKLLIEKAGRYASVVRLKGGDPYVFGRGGEEAIALRDAGIRCEVVPGVTSAVAGPACAGIPVTHRGIAGGFRVVTAHDKGDKLADIDFPSMAAGTETCIFLMGLGNLGEIVSGLLQAGMPEDTGVAVISKAAMREQKSCFGNLTNIVSRVHEKELETPAVIVVGNVVALHEKLPGVTDTGKKILVPKIGEEQSKLTELLLEKGLQTEEVQVGEIVYEPGSYTAEELEQPDWVIFTSKHGVRGFMKQIFNSAMDARNLHGVRIAVVGEKTDAALREYGMKADFTASRADSKTLFSELNSRLGENDIVWYLTGENSHHLCRQNIYRGTWVEKTVYKNREVSESRGLKYENYETAVFTCASSAVRLMKQLEGKIPVKWKENGVYSIGPVCSQKLYEMGFEKVIQPEKASYEELVSKIAQTVK